MVGSATATVELPTDEQIRITREFDAPRYLVYKAWTTPELVERWWHAGRGRVTSIEIDLRVGGTWRYAMVTPDGFEVAFHGEYLEIVPEERIVSTEVYESEPTPAGETLTAVTFAEYDGRTAVTMLLQCTSRELRDAIIASGMEDGLQDALILLEEVAVSLQRSGRSG
jgi:uncharacterized protein YndB with AHSA1/START domain